MKIEGAVTAMISEYPFNSNTVNSVHATTSQHVQVLYSLNLTFRLLIREHYLAHLQDARFELILSL